MIKSKGNEEFKQKLVKLSSQTNYPSVTILLPVSQGEFGNANSSERQLKDLIRDAHNKLSELGEDSVREIVKEKVNNISEKVRFEADTRGVAIFISSEHEEIVTLPFEVEAKVFVGYGFQIRDLVYAMNRLEEYLVLHISENKVMTLKGVGGQLNMVEIEDMPESLSDVGPEEKKDRRFTDQHFDGASAGTENFVAQGAQDDTLEKMKNFTVRIDHALSKYLANESSLRVVVIGVEKKLGYFNKYSKNVNKVIATITGNYDHSSPKAIADMVWPEVQKKIAEEKESHLQQLDLAVGKSLYVSGISQAWYAAAEGRVKTLLVEKAYQCPAILSEDGFNLDLEINGKETTPDKLKEDAVDDLIELVLRKGGDVVFVESGKLEDHQQLAAITRY